MIIDTHTHLLDRSFDSDREAIIEHLLINDIVVIENAVEPSDWKDALSYAQKYSNFFVTLGVHPHYIDSIKDSDFDTLSQLLSENKVVAVGEAGLDYHYQKSNSDFQKQVFIKHIELSNLYSKPLIVHCRDAYHEIFSLFEKHKDYKGVVHCFSGTLQDAERLIKLGFYLGIDGPVTYPNAKKLREVVEKIPLETMLVETDCPYLPPQNFRGKRNEPAYVRYVIEKIAEIKNESFEKVAEITTSNAKKLFNIDDNQ